MPVLSNLTKIHEKTILICDDKAADFLGPDIPGEAGMITLSGDVFVRLVMVLCNQ